MAPAHDGYQILGDQLFESLRTRLLDLRIGPYLLPRSDHPGGVETVPQLSECLDKLESALVSMETETIRAVAGDLHPIHLMFCDVEAVVRSAPGSHRCLAMRWLIDLLSCRQEDGLDTPAENTRVWSKFPKLRKFVTEEGLLKVKPPLRCTTDGVHIDGFIVPFHPWIPPSLNGDSKCDLLARLLLIAESGQDVALALDWRAATPEKEYRKMFYEAYWHGRPFKRNDLDDPHAIGVTIHIKPERDVAKQTWAACKISGIERAEFLWKHKDGIKTFEAEEVCQENALHHPRYLHAEYAIDSRRFRHLDGARMIYSPEDQAERRKDDCVLPRTPKAKHKPKLFRVDGEIEVDDWSDLLCLFFRDNPLMLEYVSGITNSSLDVMAMFDAE